MVGCMDITACILGWGGSGGGWPNSQPKGQFTRYNFVACDKLTTGLRHELFRVNLTYNSLTTVVYVT